MTKTLAEVQEKLFTSTITLVSLSKESAPNLAGQILHCYNNAANILLEYQSNRLIQSYFSQVKHGSKGCLAIQEGVDHLKKALNKYPNSVPSNPEACKNRSAILRELFESLEEGGFAIPYVEYDGGVKPGGGCGNQLKRERRSEILIDNSLTIGSPIV
ncbi:Uncharacterized protein Adt_21358 [Abeliophyllum distichum]|uniref:Uncharacterized protein n=1 Tax=Abeliophyllum distichum TaxID=126358 RepID=A0ABD1SZ51_9LAMI